MEEYEDKSPIKLHNSSFVNDFCNNYSKPSLCVITPNFEERKKKISTIPLRNLNCTSKSIIIADTQEACGMVNDKTYSDIAIINS